MKKREAAELLGVKSIKDLATMLEINYDSLRTMKRLSSMHIKLVRWEVDKQFIATIQGVGKSTIDATVNHLSKQSKIDKLVAQGLADEEARANDSGLDN